MMGKLDEVRLRDGVAGEKVPDPGRLEIAREHDIEGPIAHRPLDVNHLGSIVVRGVSRIGMGMQPRPPSADERVSATGDADLHRDVVRIRHGQQLPRGPRRLARGRLVHRVIHDQPIGGKSREDRRNSGKVIEVRMTDDQRLDPSDPRGPQGRDDRLDSERRKVKASRVEHHRIRAASKDVA